MQPAIMICLLVQVNIKPAPTTWLSGSQEASKNKKKIEGESTEQLIKKDYLWIWAFLVYSLVWSKAFIAI